MHKFLQLTGRFFAAIFGFLFVFSMTVAILWYGVLLQQSRAQFLKQALSDLEVYSRLPDLASELLPAKISIDSCLVIPSFCGNASPVAASSTLPVSVSPENWQEILKVVLPPEQSRMLVEPALDQGIALVLGDAESIRLPLMEVKSDLRNPSGEERIEHLLGGLPACDETILQKIVSLAPDATLPICMPLNLTEPFTPKVFQQSLYLMPDVLVISLPPEALASLRFFADCLTWVGIVPLLLLMLVVFFGIHSLKAGFRWGGILLFLSGLLALGFGAVFRFGSAGLAGLIPGLSTDGASSLSGFVRQFAEYCLGHLSGGIILLASVILGIGLLFWIVAALMPKSASDTIKDSV